MCEVRCKEVGDFKLLYFIRFGLMLYGILCDVKVIKYMDFMSLFWLRKKGFIFICLEGYCRVSKKKILFLSFLLIFIIYEIILIFF